MSKYLQEMNSRHRTHKLFSWISLLNALKSIFAPNPFGLLVLKKRSEKLFVGDQDGDGDDDLICQTEENTMAEFLEMQQGTLGELFIFNCSCDDIFSVSNFVIDEEK